MPVLYDAAGGHSWITVSEENGIRYLYLGNCEEGAMALDSEEPVFHYLWFHKSSHFTNGPVRRALVLGAGAFTAAKALALDHPAALVDAVDIEPHLGRIGRQFFHLDQPRFQRIHFHASAAEEFLGRAATAYDFIFDDLFDGFQHVPREGRGKAHARALWAVLEPGGICVKNLIWDPRNADTRSACTEAMEAWGSVFSSYVPVALGEPERGHNRLLIGAKLPGTLHWEEVRQRLAETGMPAFLVEQSRLARE